MAQQGRCILTRVTCWSPTLSYKDCHSGFKLSLLHQLLRILTGIIRKYVDTSGSGTHSLAQHFFLCVLKLGAGTHCREMVSYSHKRSLRNIAVSYSHKRSLRNIAGERYVSKFCPRWADVSDYMFLTRAFGLVSQLHHLSPPQ